MSDTLHPLFQEIIDNALAQQIQREKKSKPLPYHNEDYYEFHESRDSLKVKYNDGYACGEWF